MDIFDIRDTRDEGLDVGMGTPLSEYVAELKQRAVELCSALIPLRAASYSFENEV